MARDLLIIGAGGHGRVCAEIAQAMDFRVVGFCDAAMKAGAQVNGIPVVASSLEEAFSRGRITGAAVFVALGDNARRMELLDEAHGRGLDCPALVHPSAVVSPSCVVGPGSVLVAMAVANANTHIGRGCILNTACTVDHDNRLADGAQLCPGVHAAGNVTIGPRAFIGTGAVIIPGMTIGANAVVAAGAVVTANVADSEHVAGVPARSMRS